MLVTVYPSIYVPGIVKEVTWAEWCAQLGPHNFHHPNKNSAPAFSPCAKGAVHFGVWDFDHILPSDLIKILDTPGVFYTSWRYSEQLHHGLENEEDPTGPRLDKGQCRVRLLQEFTRPVPVKEWPDVFASMVPKGADKKCKDAAHKYFIPSAPAGTEAFYVVNKGPALVPQILGGETRSVTHEQLKIIARNWRRNWKTLDVGNALTCVCDGEAFAEHGARDDMAFRMVCELYKLVPNADPRLLALHFAPSLQLMGSDAPDILAKCTRQAEKTVADKLKEAADKVSERAIRIRAAYCPEKRDDPYTETEILYIAEKENCTLEEWNKRWILQRGDDFYFYGPRGYGQAVPRGAAYAAATRELAPSTCILTNTEGNPKQMATLVKEYGEEFGTLIHDMTVQRTAYEPEEKTLRIACSPLRGLKPLYDPNVDRWLRTMIPADKIYDVSLWIALATELKRPCAALMLTGAPGTGKSLLALGLSRLWTTEGCTTLKTMMSDFCSRVTECPLVFGDETIPKNHKGEPRTEELRQIIADTTRPYTKKFAHEASLKGAVRIILAANNEDMLSVGYNATMNDIAAISDRIYHVEVNPESIALLKDLDTRAWVDGDVIACHALWLRDNMQTEDAFQHRFLIQGDATTARKMATRSGIRSALCQWCCSYLMNPSAGDAKKDAGVLRYQGRLLVTSRKILQTWSNYVEGENLPKLGFLNVAMGGLSTRVWHAGQWYREIDLASLYTWLESTDFCGKGVIDAALSGDAVNSSLDKAN